MRSKFFLVLALALMLVLALPMAVSAAPQQAALGAAQACGTIHTTDLDNWDLGDTRSLGHNELVEGGLHIWTEDTSSQSKAAGYYPLAVPLSAINLGLLSFTGTLPAKPGLQVVVDFDGNGSPDGILVGEGVYDISGELTATTNWWASGSSTAFVTSNAPHTGGGYGSPYFGTLAEWAAVPAFSSAQVVAIGYSLGSGVHGDGIIESMTFGCYVFTFGLPGPEEPEEPVVPFVLPRPNPGFTCSVIVTEPIWGNLYAQTLGNDGWDEWNGWVVMNFEKGELSFHTHAGQSIETQYLRVIGNNDETRPRYFERVGGATCVEISNPS